MDQEREDYGEGGPRRRLPSLLALAVIVACVMAVAAVVGFWPLMDLIDPPRD